jgi:hypothetical protein
VAACSQALGPDAPCHRDFEELLNQASGPKVPDQGRQRIASGYASPPTRYGASVAPSVGLWAVAT